MLVSELVTLAALGGKGTRKLSSCAISHVYSLPMSASAAAARMRGMHRRRTLSTALRVGL